MPVQNTDFVCPPGFFVNKIQVIILKPGDRVANHPAQSGIDAAGWIPGIDNNDGGLYGWFSWGNNKGGLSSWAETFPLNYQDQTFVAPDGKRNCCRVWLKFGVGGVSIVGTPMTDAIIALQKFSDNLLPMLKAAAPKIGALPKAAAATTLIEEVPIVALPLIIP